MNDQEEASKGFSYDVSDEQPRECASWPPGRKLAWLAAGARLRRMLPKEIQERQDRFRRGEI